MRLISIGDGGFEYNINIIFKTIMEYIVENDSHCSFVNKTCILKNERHNCITEIARKRKSVLSASNRSILIWVMLGNQFSQHLINQLVNNTCVQGFCFLFGCFW